MEPASIALENVRVEYNIYGLGSRSLKKTVAKIISGGKLARDASDELTRVVALNNINLHIKDNERVGLIGSNGSGKTTLLRVMAGALKPSCGRVRRVGTLSTLFDISLGMNPEATGWDNILLRGLFMGLSPQEISRRTEELVEFSDLTPDQLSRPVRTYSSGMMMKLAFSISTSVHPEILLLDEWIGVGDANFIEKAQERMTNIVEKSRILIIASHWDHLIRSLCTKAVYLRDGEIVALGPVEEMLARYQSQS